MFYECETFYESSPNFYFLSTVCSIEPSQSDQHLFSFKRYKSYVQLIIKFHFGIVSFSLDILSQTIKLSKIYPYKLLISLIKDCK